MSDSVLVGQLRAFVEIARLGSLTRAADSLFLTQPALSSRLKRLEQALGTRLLARDRKGARLTDAGRAFLPYAQQMVSTMSSAQQVVSDIQRDMTGTLVVATTQAISTYVLPPVIRSFVVKNPTVSLRVHSTTPEQVVEAVLRGEAHVGLGLAIQHADISCDTLYEEQWVAVVDRRHRLADAERITAKELAREMLVVVFRSPGHEQFLETLAREGGELARTVIDLNDAEAAKRMVAEAIGVGLFGRTSVEREIHDGLFHVLEIEDVPPTYRSFAVLRQRSAGELPAVRAFLALLMVELDEMGLTHSDKERRAARRPLRALPGRSTRSA